MKIAILSDTHNDNQAVQSCLNYLKTAGIHTICHCGDLSSPEMIRLFDGFQVFLAFGNCDYFSGEIKEQLILLATESHSAHLCKFSLQNTPMAITHGHGHRIVDLARSGHYQYLFTGHTHQKKDETIQKCRVINPGSLQSRGMSTGTFATLELDSNLLEFHKI